jgi:hypothetical protein
MAKMKVETAAARTSGSGSGSGSASSGSWGSKWKWLLVVYAVVFCVCTQSKLVQSIFLYVHVVNFPFWLNDPSHHGLPDARNIQSKHFHTVICPRIECI